MNKATASWQWITSGVPQGLILPGPVLPKILINHPDAKFQGTISKSADDANLGGTVDSVERQKALHTDLDRLKYWDMINGTKFYKL